MPSDDQRLRALLGHAVPASAPQPSPPPWRRPWLWGVVGVACVLGGAWALRDSDGAGAGRATAPGPSAKNDMAWWNHPTLGTEEASPPVPSPAAATPMPAGPEEATGDGLFRLDGAGKLALDERTRLGVESLVALTAPEQLQDALQAQLTGLPPEAAAAARDLVSRYEGYVDAQKRSFPAGQAPLVPEEGLAELAGLQALRDSYFGRDAAQRMFGEEDAVARRLLELMRDDPLPHAPMEDKAERAQARYDAERGAAAPDQLPAR